MARDPPPSGDVEAEEPEVMASIDADGDASRLIIADITGNGRWISVSTRAAAPLAEWC